MSKPHDLLTDALLIIESRINDQLTISELSELLNISAVHLQRIFKFAFGMPLATYIRSRKLATSALKLTTTELKVIDIANEYDFRYEQSYIRAFRNEYGITPGELRKSGKIIPITPPLEMFDKNRLSNGSLFGPEIVMVPEIHLAGKQYRVPFGDPERIVPDVAKTFWYREKHRIACTKPPHVYYGLTRIRDDSDGYSSYMTAIKTDNESMIPSEFYIDTFPACYCLKFHYIGQHHYYDITADVARKMYDVIEEFVYAKEKKYEVLHQKVYFERIDSRAYDGTCCQMEWYTPIREKSRNNPVKMI